MARTVYRKKKTIPFSFGDKHKEYIRNCEHCTYNIAEGAVRAGKTIDNVYAFAHELKTTPGAAYCYICMNETIEGVQFTHVTIRTNESDGKVSSVELMNDTANTDECKGFVETFKNKLTALYGDKVAPSDSSEFEGFTVSYGDGLSCSVGGSYSANYNKFCLSFGSK